MKRSAVELWVGLFVVAGLASLGVLAFKVGNLSSSDIRDAYKVTARFDNIGGLSVKAPVTLAGVRIGRVSDIRIDSEDYRAIVELSIRPDFDNLPLDTSAAILTQGLLGAQYVGVEPGGEEEYLKDGDEIELTQSAVVLEQMLGQFLYGQAGGSE
ncbi:MAG: outer membrane lipid asymmetry maintenance protein MlaD [Arenicellales bacterium]|nr:outer membrane lipid asymmetry maintenance protein MlaD [Arenicellales bacterium]